MRDVRARRAEEMSSVRPEIPARLRSRRAEEEPEMAEETPREVSLSQLRESRSPGR